MNSHRQNNISSKRYTDYLLVFNKYLNSEYKQKNNDFVKLYNYFITCYARNSLRKYSVWKYRSKKFDFDFNSMEENGSMDDLLKIQSGMKTFKHIKFINNESVIKDYMTYVDTSLENLSTTISYPVMGISLEHRYLINKYAEYYKQKKTDKKSSKINYDALEKIQIELKIELKFI